MMKILLKACKIVSPQSDFNGQTKDILINDGIIEKIEDSISETVDQLVELENLHVSVGWFDARARSSRPRLST